MKRFLKKIHDFFFPSAGASRWQRVLPYVVLGILTILVLTAGAYAWDYTNSPPFCGEVCHTMPPEYTAYLTSPHARIDCVDCHIGKGFIATRISRKAGDLRHVIATAFNTYEFPIRAHTMRPARETCELCHSPDKFSDDSLREIKHFQNDLNNTPFSTFLTLKTGGGSKREGLGKGIHWHIENKVEYLATDPEEQHIPYIQVTNEDGSITEYTEVSAQIDPALINSEDIKEMDCITCHNRITHLVPQPEDTVDQLLTRGIISAEIPEIRLKAVEMFSPLYESNEYAVQAIAGLANYYRTYHPEYYQANQDKIDAAISALQQAYSNSVYPEQNSNWDSHPNNVGHKDSPGCFRCHDGKHLNPEGEAIRLECNLCHSIPVVAGPEDFVAEIEISRGPEPESHLNSNWISLHHEVYDATCSNCHTTENPGGTDNSSFCSNSACHGSVWEYAGFDAPGLREIILSQMPPTPTPAPTPSGGALTYENPIGAILQTRCGSCHGAQDGLMNLNLTTYASILEGGESGGAVLPGNPDGSLLVQKQSGELPHFGQLTPEELAQVIAWIEAGAIEK